MAIKIELKLPGTDLGMSLAVGHLEIKAPLEKTKLAESECECEDCKSQLEANEKVNRADKKNSKQENSAKDSKVNKKDKSETDIVTKMFTSFMQCTASNVNLNPNLRTKKTGELNKRKKLRNVKYEQKYDEDEDEEEDPLARGILSKGCSSDFSVSQSLYPDDILVSYEPRRRQINKTNNRDYSSKQNKDERISPSHGLGSVEDNDTTSAKNLKEVRIIPINKSTDAKVLPNRKFQGSEKSKYDISCISVPLFCSSDRYIGSCSNIKRHGIADSCNLNQGRRVINQSEKDPNGSYTRLVSKRNPLRCGPVYSEEEEGTLISVPSSIYPDNILLTIRSHKSRQKKNKNKGKHH
ncbi:hypothetical protein FG386_003124 [Cryptosporidium ryanae]|uniref:uncharacterized protein n=1 Tax=Cryptosporidium ryanae TaxID=515981 RepID=UPI003519E21C|nr:hypothetical protein FG386_003124 [Cryptosporidium ryanae]